MLDLCKNQVVRFYQQNVTLPKVFFKHFASKNQLPSLSICGTLVENGLNENYYFILIHLRHRLQISYLILREFKRIKKIRIFFFILPENIRKPQTIPAGNYLFKVNYKNTRTRCETCLKLTIKTTEQCQWCRSGIFIVNFEHVSQHFLVLLLLTFSKQMLAGIILSLTQFVTIFELFESFSDILRDHPLKAHSQV